MTSVDAPRPQWANLGGRVHWVDFGGPDDGPLLVAVHGLGGSHLNWIALAPLVTRTCRLVALDLAGFGHTRGEGRSTSVRGNRELLHRFVTEVAGSPVILVGNSMGGMISVFEAVTHPQDVAGLALLDPALPLGVLSRPDPTAVAMFAAYFTPGVGKAFMSRRRARLTAEDIALATLRLCCADPSRVAHDVLAAHLELAKAREYYAELEAEFLLATRSVLWWAVARQRRYQAMLGRIQAPVLLIHGDRDRLVPVARARVAARANPRWRYEELAGVGHVPQLELPQRVAEVMLDWLATEGAAAAAATLRASSPSSVQSPTDSSVPRRLAG